MKNTFNRALSMLLAILCAFSLCATATGVSYDDVDGHWAEQAIERFTGYGIVNGEGNSFNPDGSLTRAMMATILSRTLGLSETAENPFADVAEGAWYTEHVLKCYKAGIMLGDGKNANPDALISREEAMVMICRALGIKPDDSADLSSFNDSQAVSDWAVPYVSALTEKGIVGGVAEGVLAPEGSMSRGAMLTVLDRAVVQYINEPGDYTLTDKDGIVLVASKDVTLTGTTSADLIIAQGADGGKVTFNEATVKGEVTVQAEDTNIVKKDSEIGDVQVSGDSTVTEEKTEAPEEPKQPVPTGHTHDWGSWKKVDGETHTRVCRKNPEHTQTENHNWDDGVVTTLPTYDKEGVKTYTCIGCGAEYTEAVHKLEPIDKKGYDVVFTLENNILSFTLTTPESDTAPLHEVVFTDGNGNLMVGYTSSFRGHMEMILSSNRCEKVVIKTHESFADEGTVVAEWPLEKKIIATVDQFEADAEGITLTKAPSDAPDSSTYTFSGLDTENYSYTVNNRNMRDFVDNQPFTSPSDALDYENGVAQLYAYTAEETDNAYLIKRSELFTVTATVVEGGDNEGGDIEGGEDVTPDQKPLGFELTCNEELNELLYVSVLVPEITTGIEVYEVEIYNGDQLLQSIEADISDPKAPLDPRLLANGVNTVKVSSIKGGQSVGEYVGEISVELADVTVDITSSYIDETFNVTVAEDYIGIARPVFKANAGDNEGIQICSQVFLELGDAVMNFSKGGLTEDMLTALENETGFVEFSGWHAEALSANALTVTVYTSEQVAVSFAPQVDDNDYTALGIEIVPQGAGYKLTVLNPQVAPDTYWIYIYGGTTENGINMQCSSANPTVWFDPVNLSRYQTLPDTLVVASYNDNNEEVARLTYTLDLDFSKNDFTCTPVYNKNEGRMTITFPQAVNAFVHRTYKANLGDNETDLQYESLENATNTFWDKTCEPLSLIVDSVESVGGYISLDGWNSNSVNVGETSITLDFDVYNGVYSKITVNEGNSGGNQGGDIEGDENELPLDPDEVSDLSVKNIRFEDYYGRYMLMWDVAVAENDRVRYGIYVKKSTDTDWTLVTNTSQNLLSLNDADLDGSYQIKVATLLDRSIVKEVVAEGLTLVANKKAVETSAEAIFEQVEGDKYRISVKGVTPFANYVICIKEALTDEHYGSFGGSADESGNEIAGEGDWSSGSNLENKVKNGYYLVYDFSNFTLSQDGKTFSYTCTQYGDWTKCTPEEGEKAPDADENETDKDNWN